MPFSFAGPALTGKAQDFITKTINAENTWTDEYQCTSGPGSYTIVPVGLKITGSPVVTVQMKRPGGDWFDYGDTAGVANDFKISTFGTIPLMGMWSMRVGVKTGALAGGSVVVEIGTLG